MCKEPAHTRTAASTSLAPPSFYLAALRGAAASVRVGVEGCCVYPACRLAVARGRLSAPPAAGPLRPRSSGSADLVKAHRPLSLGERPQRARAPVFLAVASARYDQDPSSRRHTRRSPLTPLRIPPPRLVTARRQGAPQRARRQLVCSGSLVAGQVPSRQIPQ
jgi:hypothetical protein